MTKRGFQSIIMSISVRRVRKTRYQSTSWEHDDVPFARSKSPIQRLAPSIQQGKNHLEDEKFLSMVMGKLRAIAHFDGI